MRVITTAAGERLEVGVSGRFDGADRTVRIGIGSDSDGLGGVGLQLTPDLARSLAVGLTEAAHAAERRRGGGRR